MAMVAMTTITPASSRVADLCPRHPRLGEGEGGIHLLAERWRQGGNLSLSCPFFLVAPLHVGASYRGLGLRFVPPRARPMACCSLLPAAVSLGRNRARYCTRSLYGTWLFGTRNRATRCW